MIIKEGESLYEILPGNRLKLFRYRSSPDSQGFNKGDNVELHYSDDKGSHKSVGKIASVNKINENPTSDRSMDNKEWFEVIFDLYD